MNLRFTPHGFDPPFSNYTVTCDFDKACDWNKQVHLYTNFQWFQAIEGFVAGKDNFVSGKDNIVLYDLLY